MPPLSATMRAPVAMAVMPRSLPRCRDVLSPSMPQMLISKRLAHRSSFSARLIHAAATESGTVKMVVQGRQIQLTPSIKQYAEEKVGRAVSHFEGAVKEVDIRLSVNGGDAGHGKKRQRTEITLYTLRNGIVRAEDVEKDMYASIDLVCDRLARKLRKVKEKAIKKGKWQGRGGPKGAETAATISAPDEVSESDVDEYQDEQLDAAAFEQDQLEDATTVRQSAGTTEIMRTKNFFLKPMTVEAAAEQCDQLGHAFYLFRDEQSDQVQVVYKRRDVGYGVIVPVNED